MAKNSVGRVRTERLLTGLTFALVQIAHESYVVIISYQLAYQTYHSLHECNAGGQEK